MPNRRLAPNVRTLHGGPAVVPKNLGGGLGEPDPPAWLPAEGKREWRRIVHACRTHPTWLQKVDRALLVAYASTWATYVAAARDVAERGPLVPGRSSADAARGDDGPVLVRNPAVAVARDAVATLRGLCSALGFSPDARGRVAMGDREESDEDSDLLTGG